MTTNTTRKQNAAAKTSISDDLYYIRASFCPEDLALS